MPPSGALLLITMTNSQTNVIYALGPLSQKVKKSRAGFASENNEKDFSKLTLFCDLVSIIKIFTSLYNENSIKIRNICCLFLKIGYLSDIKEQKTNAHKGLPSRSLLFRKRF
jgi:hypothetical protein